MKCKKCGYRAKDINGMRKHYIRSHPEAMKHKGPRIRPVGKGLTQGGGYYCPYCGRRL